jgi:hypothetical protein
MMAFEDFKKKKSAGNGSGSRVVKDDGDPRDRASEYNKPRLLPPFKGTPKRGKEYLDDVKAYDTRPGRKIKGIPKDIELPTVEKPKKKGGTGIGSRVVR